jgi:PST family polysaccharide transporter
VDNLGGAVKRGIGWLAVGRGAKFLVNAVGSVALARMLEPRLFGLFAVAGLFLAFTKQLQTFGMAKAAVRLPEIRRDHLTTVFTVNVLASSTLCGAMWLAAPLLETLFHEPLAVPVLRILALGFLVNPLSSVGSAILERRMDFKSKSRANVLFSVVKIVTSVGLAFAGFGVWSLVFGTLAGQTTRALGLFVPARWRPGLTITRAAFGDLAGFGFGMFVKTSVLYLSERVDYFIVGRWLGVASLGFYERAYRLPDAVVRELGKTTGQVLFAAFSRIQEDHARIRAAFTKVLISVALPACPLLAGAALTAPAFIPVLFGEKWNPTVPPLQVLCLAGFFRLYTQLATTVMNAMGFIRAEALWRIASLLLLAGACWYATRWQLIGVAVAIVAVEALGAFVLTGLMLRTSAIGLRDLLVPQSPVLAATALMFGAVALFQWATLESLGLRSPAMLVSSILVGAIAYAASLLLFANEPVKGVAKELLAGLRPILRRLT